VHHRSDLRDLFANAPVLQFAWGMSITDFRRFGLDFSFLFFLFISRGAA
jgi:hypothetical protein